MKKILTIALVVIGFGATAQIDRTKLPEPAPAKELKLGDYEKFTLKNGLTVIVAENHKLPTIGWTLSLVTGPITEGDKAGYAGIFGQVMSAGTTSKTKDVLNEEIDFMGASVNAGATSMSAFSLSKYKDDVLGIMTDMLYNPSFPQDEFDRAIEQTLTGLQQSKDDPNGIAGRIGGIVNYGKDHPYGEYTTEESVKNISIEDLKGHYGKFFKPNIAYLVVVGDITKKEAQKMAKKYFGKWEKGDVVKEEFPTPKTVDKTIISLVDRPSSVQSVISISYPVENKPGNADATAVSVMNNILGGGGSARLFMNLREDKGYTYGAYSNVGSSKYSANFGASASVRNEVTDSSLVQFMYELRRIREEQVTQEELDGAKNFLRGSFGRSLESRGTAAQFALNTEVNNLPEDYYANYLKRLEAVTIADVQRVAKKFVRPDQANIVIVGKADEIAEKLKPFAEIQYFDLEGNEVDPEAAKAAVASVDAQSVIDRYVAAVGGAEKVKAVKDVKMVITASVQGSTLTVTSLYKGNVMFKESVAFGGNVMQEQVLNNGEAKVSAQGQSQDLPAGPQLDALKESAIMFTELYYKDAGYTMAIRGIEEVNGKQAYAMTVKSKSGSTITQFFDLETGLLLKDESAQGGQEIVEYQEVDGLKYPKKIRLTLPGLGVVEADVTVEVNTGIADTEFAIK